ncbi:unnamed protein product [Phytophthora fragariaefolia]|uniref:Unnamed protein product n=1 Tax=Phytophthora fragariaefolia TaxID=1490495 RepID=A0A9W6U6X9_9STRA|nr:unnamed protein product [Phytophthora fragariaefolia]
MQDVDLDADNLSDAATDVVSSAIFVKDQALPLDGQVHQLHSVFGRLQCHLNELASYARYHDRLVKRLETMQNKPDEHQDEVIPTYVLNLLADPTSQLMIEDEVLFYKWVNGLVLSLNSGGDADSPVKPIDSNLHLVLRAQIQEVNTLFKTHAANFQLIERGLKEEWKKWSARQKSRSRIKQMETKAESFVHEVQTRELFDPQKLFLLSQRSWGTLNAGHPRSSRSVHLATKEDVERLQAQLASVIKEITQEYCGLQLR